MSNRILTGVTLLGALVGATQTASAQDCQAVDANLAGVVVDAGNYLSESQIESGLLQGTANFAGDGQSLTQLSGITAVPAVEPNFGLTANFDVTTEGGTLNTVAVGALEAARGGLASYYHRVTGGSGVFQGAEGFLFTGFVLNEDASSFTGRVLGQVCLAGAATAEADEATGETDEEGEAPADDAEGEGDEATEGETPAEE